MPYEDSIIGLSLGFVLVAIAFVFGPGWISMVSGVLGAILLMISGLTIFLSKVEHRRGD